MKRLTLAIVLLFVYTISYSQNLVPNPGFEEQSECDSWSSLLSNGSATYWNCPSSGSSDLYNYDCAEVGTIHSGIGSAGIITYHTVDYREYLQIPLTQPLTQGKKCCIEFYIASLFDDFDALGVYFSDTLVEYNSSMVLDQFTPQLQLSEGTIIGGMDFQLLEWEYYPNGSEQYMIVGNFNTDANTTVSNGEFDPINYAYCYLDDFSIVECEPDVSVNEADDMTTLNISPNPNNGEFQLALSNLKDYTLDIYDSMGSLVLSESENSNPNITVNLRNESSGVYTIVIRTANDYITKRIIIDK